MVESGSEISRSSSTVLTLELVDDILPYILYPIESWVLELYYAASIIGFAVLVLLSTSNLSV